MKIYVASKFTNAAAVRSAIGKLLYAGHTITFDWTCCSDEELKAKVAEAKIKYETTQVEGAAQLGPWEEAKAKLENYWRWCAEKDVQGVHDAEAFVMLPVVDMKGAWMELGISLSRWTMQTKKPYIFIVGEIEETVFVHHAAIERVASVEDVISALAVE